LVADELELELRPHPVRSNATATGINKKTLITTM